MLGVTHTVGALVKVLEDSVAKIANWPTSTDQTSVRGFLDAVGIKSLRFETFRKEILKLE